MNLTESLIASVLGALIVWIISGAVAHLIRRARCRGALLADIGVNLSGAQEQSSAVAKLVADHVVAGRKIDIPIAYFVGEYLLYKSLQAQLPSYLSKAELVKVVKFYQALWEMDVSINGFAYAVGEWERRGTVLTDAHVAHAVRRMERIESLCAVLSGREIKEIGDLPDDYRTVKGPETVVGKP